MGVTHVVSCLEANARAEVDFLKTSFDHLFLPAQDDIEQDISGAIDELEDALRRHDFDTPAALRSIYGGEIPRVVQGKR